MGIIYDRGSFEVHENLLADYPFWGSFAVGDYLLYCTILIKTSTRRIMRPGELSLVRLEDLNDTLRKVVRLDALCGLVPTFIIETHNQTGPRDELKFAG